MIYHSPLMQVQCDALQREFWYQRRAKELPAGGRLKAEPTKPFSALKPAKPESSVDGLFLLTAALAAAPTVFSLLGKAAEAFFDTVLVEGDPALKQSHVNKFSQAAQMVLGTELTLDEDTTLRGILKWIWETGDSGPINAVWQITTHAKSLSPGAGDAWAEKARGLFESLVKVLEDPCFKYWVQGVRACAILLSGSTVSVAKRKSRLASPALERNIDTLHTKIQAAQEAKEEALRSAVTAEQGLNRAKEKAHEERARLDAQLAANYPRGSEPYLRRIFASTRSEWEDLLVAPHISETKIKNAREACKLPMHDKVIALFDFTFFGSAKTSVVFGVEGFYFRSGASAFNIRYDSLGLFTISLGATGLTLKSQSETPLLTIQGSSSSSSSLLRALTALRRQFS